MTSEKGLSNKKTSQQTISISPALKDKIQRYINENKKNKNNPERYKSISAFYNYVLEKNMEIFKGGKTLDDFDRFFDYQISEYVDKFTFKASVPLHEMISEANRYSNFDFGKSTRFWFLLRDFFLKDVAPYDFEEIKKRFGRFKKFVITNKLTKETNIDFFTEKDSRSVTGVFEYTGTYRNLHFENCKNNAVIFGAIGIKITNVIYSDKDMYCRINFKVTDLFWKEFEKNERIKLMKHNLSYFINYYEVLMDKDHFFWTKTAEDKNLLITFRTKKDFDLLLKKIEKDLKQFSMQENLKHSVIKIFEKMHWIDIENEEELSFQIKLNEERYTLERKFMLNYLSKYSKVSEIDGTFFLE